MRPRGCRRPCKTSPSRVTVALFGDPPTRRARHFEFLLTMTPDKMTLTCATRTSPTPMTMKLKTSSHLKYLLTGTLLRASAIAAIGLLGTHQVQAADGSWGVDAAGNWSNESNWVGGDIPGAASVPGDK